MNNYKRHIKRFDRCLQWHEAQKDDQGNETRAAFYSFSTESMEKKPENKLYEYYRTLSDVLYNMEMDHDSRYRFMAICIDAILNNDLETVDELEDWEFYEEASNNIDCYTYNLTKWLNASINNVYYLTDVLTEHGPKDGFELLTIAQGKAIEEVYRATIDAIVKFVKEKQSS